MHAGKVAIKASDSAARGHRECCLVAIALVIYVLFVAPSKTE
jgi:hypothetical protein